MSYKRSDYGADPHAGAPRNDAPARGWGSGWPHCQSSEWMTVAKAGVRVVVHEEIATLVALLLEATEKVYKYDVKAGQTWGAACRAIRGTSTPSNHSYGLAVDINSLSNPMQATFKTNIPPQAVAMWEACGFYWGGRYKNRPDTMHFEYIGKPANVAAHMKRARRYLEGTTTTDKPEPTPTGVYEVFRNHAKTGSRTIQRSNAGSDVRELQRILNEWYPNRPRLTEDGYFGAATETAVRFMQKAANLGIDGIVGPKTWAALKVGTKVYEPPPFPTGLAPGRRKPSAVALQRALKAGGYLSRSVRENANYGPQTQAAVARFHTRNPQFRARGVVRDVRIGPKGWAFLFRSVYGQ